MNPTHTRRLIVSLLILSGSLFSAEKGPIIIREGFEAEIPDFHTYRAQYAPDTVHPHSGTKGLRVTAKTGTGGAYFRLDGLIDPTKDYEFSAWVHSQKDGVVSLYVSAAGDKGRFVVSRTNGGVKDQWVKITGQIRSKQWKGAEDNVMLAMTTQDTSWFDDVILRTTHLPDPPVEVWPELKRRLRATADTRVTVLRPGETLKLDATDAALAADMGSPNATSPETKDIALEADSILIFAVDTPSDMHVTGTLTLRHGADLRPGLRAYVLGNTTLLAAPMLTAPPWECSDGKMTNPLPAVTGEVPPMQIKLRQWHIPAGRHYLAIAGPHYRAAGQFQSLEISASPSPPEKEHYQFALFSDTHVAKGRSVWMNRKLCDAVSTELTNTLTQLSSQGTRFGIIAGDMVDGATRPQFEQLADTLRAAGLPMYGCVGNHDAYHASSRSDLLELLPSMFPGGSTDYAFSQPPLRFVVLDGSYWRRSDGTFTETYERGKTGAIGIKPAQIQWLKNTLEADTVTPTVVVWHYSFLNHGGVASSGYKLPTRRDKQILPLLEATPNVIATMNGHTHWNSVDSTGGITCIQNAAFVEWPNMYRLFRVYDDRIEWEVRLADSFGFVRESFVPEKALSWVISTHTEDLSGTVPFGQPEGE